SDGIAAHSLGGGGTTSFATRSTRSTATRPTRSTRVPGPRGRAPGPRGFDDLFLLAQETTQGRFRVARGNVEAPVRIRFRLAAGFLIFLLAIQVVYDPRQIGDGVLQN